MRTLMLCLVMLMVIGLCAVSANADRLIDSFNYSNTAALDAVWWGNGTPNPTVATIGGVPCMDMPGSNGQWISDLSTPLNLTGLTGFTLSMAGSGDRSAIFYTYVQLWDGGSYYTIANYNYHFAGDGPPDTLNSSQMQAGFCPLGWGSGPLTDFSHITRVILGCYIRGGTPGDLYVSNLVANGAAVPEPGSLLALGFGLLGTAGLVIRRRS